jgi:hypothetical protein
VRTLRALSKSSQFLRIREGVQRALRISQGEDVQKDLERKDQLADRLLLKRTERLLEFQPLSSWRRKKRKRKKSSRFLKHWKQNL